MDTMEHNYLNIQAHIQQARLDRSVELARLIHAGYERVLTRLFAVRPNTLTPRRAAYPTRP
jgi:hypothetical protein